AADVGTTVSFPASVNAGQSVSGTVTFRNNGPYTANGVGFTLTMNPTLGGVTFGNLPTGASASYNAGTGAVVFSGMPTTLAANAIASGDGSTGITVTYLQNAVASTTVTGVISTTTNEGLNTFANSAAATITGVPIADVTTELAFTASADAGTPVSGTVGFRNAGPSTATGLTYALTMSPGLGTVTFGNMPGGATASYSNATGVVTFTGMPSSLLSGQYASGNGTSFITAAYTQPGTGTSTISSAITTATNQGANALGDTDTHTLTGQLVADVTTSMAFPASANAGDPVSGTVVFRNNGPSTASATTFSLTLTSGLGTVTFGNLPAGASATYNSTSGGVTFTGMPTSLGMNVIASGNGTTGITVAYTQPGTGLSTIASAIATGTNQGANLAPDAASAAPGGGLVADVRAQVSFPATVNAAQAVTGTVRFGNDGPSPASGVTYTLTMTTGLTGLSFANLPAGATASYDAGSGVVTFTGMPSVLASGAVASGDGVTGITVNYTQNIVASSTVTAGIGTSTSQGANAAPDTGTATVTGALIADVTTALTFPGSVPVGQVVNGRVTFSNAGPSVASALTYGMTLVTNLTGVSVGNLPGGASASYNPTTGAVTFTGMPATAAPNTIISGDGTTGVTVSYTQPNLLTTSVSSVIGTGTDQGTNALPDNATLTVSGLQLTDLGVTKVARFTDAAPGDTLTWRIRATNNGPVALDAGSTLTDENLVGMTLLQVRCTATATNRCATAPTPSALLATTTMPALAVGEFYEIDVDGVVTATDGGSVSNAARVAVPSGFLDTDNTNDRAAAAAVPVFDAPDLALTKTADSLFVAGRTVQYTLDVRNVGRAATAGPITVTDPLPAGVTFISSTTADWTCSAAGQLVSCTTGNTLAVNAQTSVSFGVSLDLSTVGSLVNTATVATARDRVVPNNTASVTRTVLGPPDLAVTKTVDTDTLRLNGSATWTVNVANVGGAATTGPITVIDSLPAGLTPVSVTGTTFTCTTVGTVVTCSRTAVLAAGATASLQIAATLSPTAPIAPLQNTARASTAGDVNPANDAGSVTVAVGGQSVASLRKVAVGEFVVGEAGRFRMTVQNTGTLPLLGPIAITDTLPRGLRYRGVEGAGWNCSNSGTVTRCTTPGPVAVGDSAAMVLVTDVLPEAVPEVTNCAVVDATGGAIIGAAARSCATVRPRGDYRLVLELTTPRYDRDMGDVPDFYVTVRNIGRSPLPDVRLTNLLPAGFVYAAGTSRRSGAPDRDFGPDGQPRNTAVQPLPGRSITAIADPANAATPSITWPLGDMLPGDVIRIDYRTFIRTGASFNADNVTISSAVSDVLSLSVASNVAKTPIRLRRGVFDMRGVIAGKVYAQCDCAGARGQQPGDVGIPGVRVVMEDGTGAITDAEGKYNFVNVRAGLHVVKVDRSTLPTGASPVALVTRNAGDGATRFVDLKAGELHRADFAAALASQESMDALLARRRQGEPTAAGDGAMLSRLLSTPMALTATAGMPPQGQRQAPVLGAQGGAAAAGTTAGAGAAVMGDMYVPIAMPDLLHDGNSSRPATPRRAAAALVRQPGVAEQGGVSVQLPTTVIPADGRRTTAVVVRVQDAAGTPVKGRTAVTLETSAGTWAVQDLDVVQPGVQVEITDGAGVVPLVSPALPVVAEVRASTAQGSGAQSVSFVPPLRPFMAAGLLQGRIDVRSLSRGGLVLSAEDDVFEDALRDGAITRDSGQFRAGARGAVLLKGAVKGAGLLTLAFDTERDPARSQFRDITPDNGFQVFGDGSLREFDAQSQQRLYARLDRGASSLMYGDFATPRSDDRRMLLSYDRSMTGLAYHAEGVRGVVNSFGARNSIRQVVDELPSRGLSGPYYLSRTTGVVNSERIEIITRDRNQPSVILARKPMTRFEEYSVEPGTGRVIFRAPVPSMDGALNPVSIRVSYEVDQGGSQFYTYGGDATLRLTTGLEVGAFAVRDENPVDRQTMLGMNATMALGKTSTMTGEVGRTESVAGVDPAYAWRVEMRHRSSRMEGRIFALRTDTAFANRSSTMSGGRTEFGTRWSATVNDRTRVMLDGLITEDERTGGRRTGASVGLERRLNSSLVAEVGYRWADANGAAVTPIIGQFVTGQNAGLAGGGLSATTAAHFNAARVRLSARIPNSVKGTVFGEYEHGLDASSATRGAVGGEYLLANRTRMYAQHEWTSSQQGAYGLAEDRSQQNTVFGIDADWLRNSQTFSEYRARDAFNGRDAEASIGLRNRWMVKRGVALSSSFERVTPLAGNTTGAYAATGGLEWTASELWKGTARMEYRNSPTGDNVFGTLGYARKISRDWTLLTRTGWDALQGSTMRGRSQLGMAWRQTDRNTVNALFRYENRLDQNTTAGSPETRNVADVLAALVNIQPNPWWTISTRYAAKVARDRVDDVTVQNTAHLMMARSVHDLSRRVDVGVIGSVLGNGSFSERRYGLGGELGLVVMRNLRLAGGYNLFGFSDRDFQSLGYTQRGPYLEFGFKFDETLFGSPRRGQESRK
ncbi:MAG: DUF11 domain-containing protein, partial [Gemmatimonadaceae bacterium]|nr:DUF11 domain-containing protein [Gemmatimonadaceae bacterium]